jgi:hypothetical protein
MKAKEKAKELIEKLTLSSNAQDGSWMCEDLAKRCALIAVDEIINTNALANIKCGYVELTKEHLQYWQEVKQEIQKVWKK